MAGRPGACRSLCTVPDHVPFAQHYHAIVPVNDLALGVHPAPVATRCASNYPCFYLLGYAVDVIILSSIFTRLTGVANVLRDATARPKLGTDGHIDGHAVLWVDNCCVMVDPTIMHRQRLHVVTADSKLSLPVILPVPLRELVLGPTAGVLPACRRSPLEIASLPQPNWTQAITPAPGTDLDAAIRYGALALAYAALELLSGLREIRDDLAGGKLASSYPELGALLLGRIHIPALPEQPPKGFWQLCSMTTTGSPTVSN